MGRCFGCCSGADVLGVVLDSVKLEKLPFLVFTQEFARPIENTV